MFKALIIWISPGMPLKVIVISQRIPPLTCPISKVSKDIKQRSVHLDALVRAILLDISVFRVAPERRVLRCQGDSPFVQVLKNSFNCLSAPLNNGI